MQAEREALIKKVFPELRRKCLERGAQLDVVDLRWGITDEQARQNKVVRICLDLVDACRPFFVGLIGQRYGWIPDAVEPDVLQSHAWLRDRPRISLTEMEIRHGAPDWPRPPRSLGSIPGR